MSGYWEGHSTLPTNGHLAMAFFARELLSLDRLILSVSDNPLKQQRSASDSERKAMTELRRARNQ